MKSAMGAALLPLLQPPIRNTTAVTQASAGIADSNLVKLRRTTRCAPTAIRNSAAALRLKPLGDLCGRVSSLCEARGDSDINSEKKANKLNNKMGWQCQRASPCRLIAAAFCRRLRLGH